MELVKLESVLESNEFGEEEITRLRTTPPLHDT